MAGDRFVAAFDLTVCEFPWDALLKAMAGSLGFELSTMTKRAGQI